MGAHNLPRPAAVYGIDIGKMIFHVVGIDVDGTPIQKVQFRRETLLHFFARAKPAIVGMEAFPGSQWLARKLLDLGHKVKILPAQFVTPYVKSNKSDIIAAAAIAEAATRPTMRFVTVKRTGQVDLQALHRIRDQLVAARTGLINQMRASCLEYGVSIRQGAGVFKVDLPRVIEDVSNDITPMMRRMFRELFADHQHLEARIAAITKEIGAIASKDEVTRRLMTVPGIGPIVATAIVAAVGDGKPFRSARDLAAGIGLVPRKHSTGGKTTLLGIGKRGNSFVRRLLIHGARSCLLHLDRGRDRLGAWIDSQQARVHRNKVIVALAAKIARIAWVIVQSPAALYERRDPMFA